MIDIIQIYKNKEIFHKSNYTPENRKRFHKIDSTYVSRNGYLKSKTLYLPTELKQKVNIQNSEVIIIQDIKDWDSFLINKALINSGLPNWYIEQRQKYFSSENPNHFIFQQINSFKDFEIFSISKNTESYFELSLSYNHFSIGEPKRENHKICNLKLNSPIRYRINGKSDFTMSGGKERTYYEYDYIIEFVGSVKKVEFLELNKIKVQKEIPLENCKLIDERKVLY
jgi:hypothetical protein